jgi:glycosyltransferase involved in cell wall biosynthesis
MTTFNNSTRTNPSPTLAFYSADHPQHICPLLRVVAPAQASGWRVLRGVSWETGKLNSSPDVIHQAQAVLIQRDFPAQIEAYREVMDTAHSLGKPVIYDLDDLLTELPEDHPGAEYYRSRRAAVLAAAAQADAVTCTTQGLAEYLRNFNSLVTVLPNYLIDTLWTLRSPVKDRQSSPLIMGYLGSSSHVPDLEMIVPILARLLDEYGERLVLRLWGIPIPDRLAGRSNVESLDIGMVSYAEFAAYFSRQDCDLFIAPLQDNLFNRCKSAIKFLEYSALGVPGVYSNLPPYSDVITPGKNGQLAATPDEWLAHLTDLIEDPALRSQLGEAAQATLRQNWLLSRQVQGWQDKMHSLMDAYHSTQKPNTGYHLAEKFLAWSDDNQKRLAKISELESRLSALDSEYQELRSQWAQVQTTLLSPSWRLFKLVDAFRLKLAPPESGRDRAVHGLMNFALRLKRGPLAGFFRRAVPERFADVPAEQQPVQITIKDGMGRTNVATTVIIERNPLLLALDENAVLAWVARQTCRDVQVVTWDSTMGKAEMLTGESRFWDAPDLEILCTSLPGRYICMAYADLLQQNETYLETNQIALTSEQLTFTLNARGPVDWPARHLDRAYLPGCRLTPFFRMVVDKNYVRRDFSLDLSTCLSDGNHPVVIGKLLMHTSGDHEYHMAYPMETKLVGIETALKGQFILARPPGSAISWEGSVLEAQSVHSVLEVSPLQDARPTVIVVFPFLAMGGAEQLHLHVFQRLERQFRFVILTVDRPEPALGSLADAFRSLTPYIYHTPDFLSPSLRHSFLWRLMERFQPVSFYIANGASWAYDVLPEIKRRYPYIRTIDQVYDSQVGWIYRYDGQVVANLDGCIGANNKICQAYIERGMAKERVHQVEHGIDAGPLDPADYPPERIASLKEKLNLPADRKVVTFASRLHPQKRPMDVVELARRMHTDPSVIFLIIGDGPLAQVLDEQIAKIGLTNVLRYGFYRPISDVLSVTNVLILPSEYEGMPLIVSEAQIMGKAVVVTDVGNNREVLERTGGGVVVQHLGDVAALMNGVRQMLQTPPDAAQVRQNFLAHYGIDVIAEKYGKVLLGK